MKSKKNYPMNGPTLEMQKLMERPRANRERIESGLKYANVTRNETLSVLKLK